MELFSQTIVDKVYEIWRTTRPCFIPVQELHHQLSRQERCAFHFAQLRAQVMNGGFIQWFENGYGCKEALECLCHEASQMPDTDAVLAFQDIIDRAAAIIHEHLATEGFKNVAEYMANFDSLAVAGELEDHHPHYFLTAALDPLDELYYGIVDALDPLIELHVHDLSA